MLCQLCELLFIFYLALGKVPVTHGCFIIIFFFLRGWPHTPQALQKHHAKPATFC